jgi:hypothetical protein
VAKTVQWSYFDRVKNKCPFLKEKNKEQKKPPIEEQSLSGIVKIKKKKRRREHINVRRITVNHHNGPLGKTSRDTKKRKGKKKSKIGERGKKPVVGRKKQERKNN